MILLRRSLLDDFSIIRPEAAGPLGAWKRFIEANDFRHFAQLKATFGSADYVRPYTVFDIGGNKFRLVALVNYTSRTVMVTAMVTHKEYDQGKWRRGR